MRQSMKPQFENFLRSFLVEFVVYGLLVAAYYLLVLHYLGHWLYHLFKDDRRLYAGVALGLIIGQGILLDLITRLLLAWIRPRVEEQ
jgi:hypothetical protein